MQSMPQLMAAYNQWQNAQLYLAAARLSEAERQADRGAFFKSIHGTLNHILWGDLLWLGRFTSETLCTSPVGQDLYADFDALAAARSALDERLLNWAAELTPQQLQESVTWTSQLYGFTQTIPRWVQIQHMFNHQTHHRAQVGTLLKQCGIDVGVTDIPMLPGLGDKPCKAA